MIPVDQDIFGDGSDGTPPGNCFAATLAVCTVLAMLVSGGPLLLALGALFGGLSFALYPLCVAHCNDRLLAIERVAASAGAISSPSCR